MTHVKKCSICGKNKGWISIHSGRWICHKCEPLSPKIVAREAGLYWGNCSYNRAAKVFTDQLKEELRKAPHFKSLPAVPRNLNWNKWFSSETMSLSSPLGGYLICLLGIKKDKNPRLTEKELSEERNTLLMCAEKAERILNCWGSSLEEIIFFDCLTPRMFSKAYKDLKCEAINFQLKGMNVKLWNRKLDSAIKKLKTIKISLESPPNVKIPGFDGPTKEVEKIIQYLGNYYLASTDTSRKTRNSSKGFQQFWLEPIDWNEVCFWVIEILQMRGVPIEKELDSEGIYCSTKLLEFIMPTIFPEEQWAPQAPSLRKQYNRLRKSFLP